MVKLKIYNNTSWSLVQTKNDDIYKRKNKDKWWEKYPSIYSSDLKEKDVDYNKEIERISLSRTKRNIKEICLCNDFQYFATITVNSKNSDRFSLQDCQDKMKKICHKLKRKNNEFKFLFITERHKDGAFHFHGLVKSLDLYVNSYGYYSSYDFDDIGFNSFSKIQDYNKCCTYITKYITKQCVRNESGQIYFCSRGLKKCTEYYMVDTDLKKLFNGNIFENEWCLKKDFDISCIDRGTLLRLNDYFQISDTILSQQNNNNITNLLQLLTNKFVRYI